MINIDGFVREGKKYKDNHPSKPSALRLPVKTMGTIKSFSPFRLPATRSEVPPLTKGVLME
jgi:hypothetical protein